MLTFTSYSLHEFYFILIFFVYVQCLQVIPERAFLTYANSKYLEDVIVNVRRISRRGDYVLNVEGTLLKSWSNNVTMEIKFYEYLHNEYKPSFIDMRFKMCDLINGDEMIGALLRRYGLDCPLRVGRYNLTNMSLANIPAVQNFPYTWPFEKGKATFTFKTHPEKVLIVEAYAIANFKQTSKEKKKSG